MVDNLKALSLEKLQAPTRTLIDIDDLVTAAYEAYTDMHQSFDDLKTAIVKIFHQNRRTLLPDPRVTQLLDSTGPMGRQILQYLYESVARIN
ncbi:hypothetical protein S40288_11766 [Stachybotrys chartarum IBT 40288]|nr:hypothetical protein S40288_11766 [Stachybotrys chartarum IBT 40288]